MLSSPRRRDAHLPPRPDPALPGPGYQTSLLSPDDICRMRPPCLPHSFPLLIAGSDSTGLAGPAGFSPPRSPGRRTCYFLMTKGKLRLFRGREWAALLPVQAPSSAPGLLDLTGGSTFLKAEWAPRCGSCFLFPTRTRRAAGTAFLPIPLMEKLRPREVKPVARVTWPKKTRLSWLPA